MPGRASDTHAARQPSGPGPAHVNTVVPYNRRSCSRARCSADRRTSRTADCIYAHGDSATTAAAAHVRGTRVTVQHAWQCVSRAQRCAVRQLTRRRCGPRGRPSARCPPFAVAMAGNECVGPRLQPLLEHACTATGLEIRTCIPVSDAKVRAQRRGTNGARKMLSVVPMTACASQESIVRSSGGATGGSGVRIAQAVYAFSSARHGIYRGGHRHLCPLLKGTDLITGLRSSWAENYIESGRRHAAGRHRVAQQPHQSQTPAIRQNEDGETHAIADPQAIQEQMSSLVDPLPPSPVPQHAKADGTREGEIKSQTKNQATRTICTTHKVTGLRKYKGRAKRRVARRQASYSSTRSPDRQTPPLRVPNTRRRLLLMDE